MRVGGKLWRPYRFKHLHDRPVYHSVTEWQFIDFTAFALVFYKNIIGAGLVPFFCQFPVQLRQVLLQIGEKCRYLIALALAAGGVVRRLPQVVYVANARIQIAISFHFGSSGLSLGFGSAMLASEAVEAATFGGPTGTLCIGCYLLPCGTVRPLCRVCFCSSLYRGDE